MARIAGVDLPKNKRGEIGLTYIYGIGRSSSQAILTKLGIDYNTKVKDWNDDQIAAIRGMIASEFKIEGELLEDLAVAGRLQGHARRQLLQRRQRLDLLVHLAHRAAIEVHGDGDVATTVEAVDLRRAAVGADLRHCRQRHAAAVGAGHAQLAQHGRIGQ